MAEIQMNQSSSPRCCALAALVVLGGTPIPRLLAFRTVCVASARGGGCGVASSGGFSSTLIVRGSSPGGSSTPTLKILPSFGLFVLAFGFGLQEIHLFLEGLDLRHEGGVSLFGLGADHTV